MPKIVSSSTISASTDLAAEKNLLIYYCVYCGEFLMVLEKAGGSVTYQGAGLVDSFGLPRRKTDNAYIVNEEKRTYRFNMETGPTKIVKRDDGYEKQHRMHCPRCKLFVAYDQKRGFTYVLDGAVHATAPVGPPVGRDAPSIRLPDSRAPLPGS
ncbi:hypothetical protein BDK51DRAFT_53248 [Blyttiomyces helicus]|uniref:STEEP1 domain-containing protein n=1 Tax=Blyttiomyces helicus TaxID=388810 RepID=A0A4V1IR85_9FUNG|nr:hypothetical protein BDK51DRAFT_53248 [Blyttiomyces helicus]|eukprot:RKO89177.1 hypothetical protein BDK51DRAFT_53248 [Blyttiomyces helicus]